MSKVNRRQEIKQKEDFQLKFQLALAANNNNVLKWLPNSHEEALHESQNSMEGKDSFLDLPVIPNGAGLSDLDKDENINQSQTIGSFLSSETIPKKRNLDTTRDIRTGSKSMSALMNKMRTENRKNMNDKYQVHKAQPEYRARSKIMEDIKKQKQKQPSKSGDVQADAVDSDEEESKSKQIGGKKQIIPQFGKKGKSKGRPF